VTEWAEDDAAQQLATPVASSEMDDVDRWLAQHESEMAL
jgi:hypothetical protein